MEKIAMPLDLQCTDWSGLNAEQRQALLRRPVARQDNLHESVTGIIKQVRQGGDTALEALTLKLDGVTPISFELTENDLESALKRVDPKLIEALEDAASRIEVFHRADLPRNGTVETAPGLTCRVHYQPLSPVGLYIPGGSAPLVSTVLMLAIPARIAGCREVIMCSPPGTNGRIADEILAAAHLCGVTRVFCAGGAQAVAAMAYGAGSVPRCCKIFGPGNSWVTAAKQQVSQDPEGAAIDMPAGPSEVLVIADDSANAEFIAWDLMSQAEHGPDSQVILLSPSQPLINRVIDTVQEIAPSTSRAAILGQSLAEARFIRVKDLAEAIECSNDYAPEHLIINTVNAPQLAAEVENAGSVFIGPWTPESLGDYCSGTNHVLPTYGWARSHGALGVGDYLRRMTFQEASRSALENVGPTAEIMAAVEGLEAHKMAVTRRLSSKGSAT